MWRKLSVCSTNQSSVWNNQISTWKRRRKTTKRKWIWRVRGDNLGVVNRSNRAVVVFINECHIQIKELPSDHINIKLLLSLLCSFKVSAFIGLVTSRKLNIPKPDFWFIESNDISIFLDFQTLALIWLFKNFIFENLENLGQTFIDEYITAT